MNTLITFTFFIFTFGPLYGQKKQCHCNKDTLMNNATVSCETRMLKNKAQLYWQYNCDKIWLTLETSKRKKITIDKVPVEYYGYIYRLGFHFVKEFNNSILFRSGCAANGPCIYTLIDKTRGKKIDEFGQLICIDTDIKDEKKYPFEFLVYADSNYKRIIIYYPDTKKVLKVPFDFEKNNVTAVIPEYQFDRMEVSGNILTLYYTTSEDKKLNLKINLKNKK
ncbi:hypothetical protein [Chryseobacterium oncorhynchi]|uniref:Uncharacterized protein n=1 Tax=Chryseobacterium oncorhynchi TaxID=741074 RepID=A0A316WPE1_9FLAO|nr:hypothetical protein [Chryseobacterium oncorhynchi]PWN63294.1 hypothetical protein C1638_014595 [Chryseobacterium oncorhynchi]